MGGAGGGIFAAALQGVHDRFRPSGAVVAHVRFRFPARARYAVFFGGGIDALRRGAAAAGIGAAHGCAWLGVRTVFYNIFNFYINYIEENFMNLHEYQSKQLFAARGLPVSKHVVVSSSGEIEDALRTIGGARWVVKAQVHAGGRGKAGGVKLVDSAAEAKAFAESWLGNRLVSYQTDAEGQPVNRILVEECTEIGRELYLGAVIDRSASCLSFIASTEGGVEIEKVAAETPEKLIRLGIDPLLGANLYQGRLLGYQLGLEPQQVTQFADIFVRLAKMFDELDLSLLEINPLVITDQGRLHCLDAKLAVDDNALHRQPELTKMRDPTQDDPREMQAAEHSLSYVALDGNIGCMVNGAGLAMGTMDTIKLRGGEPANFLDVGGGATSERVAEAFKIILSDENVRAVLINIFGGIVRCDLIAEGIIQALEEVRVEVPVIVRLEGNSAEAGSRILADSNLGVEAANTLDEAATLAVAAVSR